MPWLVYMYRLRGGVKGRPCSPPPHRDPVARALQAFVGVLMALVLGATVFLRASRGDERQLGGRGSGSPRTVLNAVHSALLSMTTVGYAEKSRVLYVGSRLAKAYL